MVNCLAETKLNCCGLLFCFFPSLEEFAFTAFLAAANSFMFLLNIAEPNLKKETKTNVKPMAQGNQMRCLSHGHLSGFHTKKYKNISWKRKSIHKTCCVNGSVIQDEFCFAFTIFLKHASDVTTTANTSSSPSFVCLKKQKLQTKVLLENTRICDVSLPYVKTGICNISKF